MLQEDGDSQYWSPASGGDADARSEWPLIQPPPAPHLFWRESPEILHGTSVQRQCALVKSGTGVTSLTNSRCDGTGAEQAQANDLSACPKLLREASLVLKEWFLAHLADPMGPYPTRAQKEMLAAEINCSRQQVENWFLNARRRWKHGQTSSSRTVY